MCRWSIPGAIFPQENPEECTVKRLQRWPFCRGAKTTGTKTQLDTSCLSYSIKCQTKGVPEVICGQRHTTTCMSHHNSSWLVDLSPPNNPINAHTPSLDHRLSLSSKVSYYYSLTIHIQITTLRLPPQPPWPSMISTATQIQTHNTDDKDTGSVNIV